MIDPWNLRNTDARGADSITTFLIFCEDEVSEPHYFKVFETGKTKINIIPNQQSKTQNVIRAIKHCKDAGMMTGQGAEMALDAIDVEVWCVFDRDSNEPDNDSKVRAEIAFDESIETATQRGFRVAWSNDSFELWVLLHFEKVDPTNISFRVRSAYYERLTAVFRALAPGNQLIQKEMENQRASYKETLKSRNNFVRIVRPELDKRIEQGIANAKELEAYHNATPKGKHQMAPCTSVHHLVEALQEAGK